MKVGIVLGGFQPDAGGGYTFQKDIFEAFVSIAGECEHSFVVLCDSEYMKAYALKQIVSSNVEVHMVESYGWRDKALKVLRNDLVYSRLFKKHKGRLERAAINANIDCVWFPMGGVNEILDTPYIATVWDIQHRSHPWFPEFSSNGVWNSRELDHRRFLQRAAYVIVGTQAGQKELRLFYGIPDERVVILPHPTPSFSVLKSTRSESEDILNRIGGDADYLLYPAQFWPHKNHINLLYALHHLKVEYKKNIPLVLVGSDKGNMSYVKETALKLDMESQVHFLGFVSQDELITLYRHACALTYVSFCGPENLPPLEAFSLQCPVIASDIQGAHEQLGDCAWFVQPDNPADIANGIKFLLENRSLRRDLIMKGKKRAEKWTGLDFARSVMNIFDGFENIRRVWK